MAERKVYVGNEGPFIYDDQEALGDTLDFPGIKRAAIVTDGKIVGVLTADQIGIQNLVAGTSREITVTDDGDDTITLSIPELWDDIRVPATAIQQGGVKDPDFGTVLASGNLRTWLFDDSVIEEVFFVIQLPHSYKEGSTIKPHVHWMPTTAAAGDVKWGLEYSWANIGDVFSAPPASSYTTAAPTTTLTTSAPTTLAPTTVSPVTSNTIYIVDAAAGTAWEHQVASFGDVVGSGKKISSMLICRLFRDASDPDDTYADDAALLEFDLHFKKDALGSLQEYVK